MPKTSLRPAPLKPCWKCQLTVRVKIWLKVRFGHRFEAITMFFLRVPYPSLAANFADLILPADGWWHHHTAPHSLGHIWTLVSHMTTWWKSKNAKAFLSLCLSAASEDPEVSLIIVCCTLKISQKLLNSSNMNCTEMLSFVFILFHGLDPSLVDGTWQIHGCWFCLFYVPFLFQNKKSDAH